MTTPQEDKLVCGYNKMSVEDVLSRHYSNSEIKRLGDSIKICDCAGKKFIYVGKTKKFVLYNDPSEESGEINLWTPAYLSDIFFDYFFNQIPKNQKFEIYKKIIK